MTIFSANSQPMCTCPKPFSGLKCDKCQCPNRQKCVKGQSKCG